jgi:hypothetical protein
MNGLREALPDLVPPAVEWAERISAAAALTGVPLNAAVQELARRVGVVRPENVRVSEAAELPFPEHPMLQAAATQTGLLGPHMSGLTLGYTVFVRTGHLNARLLSHELRHVAQYEAAGSIGAFLPVYLGQIVEVGYDAAPFEVDARNHEIAV